NQARRLQAPL
ncbi:hypothetical protein BN1708_019743, partial [Verticillium longisporum]